MAVGKVGIGEEDQPRRDQIALSATVERQGRGRRRGVGEGIRRIVGAGDPERDGARAGPARVVGDANQIGGDEDLPGREEADRVRRDGQVKAQFPCPGSRAVGFDMHRKGRGKRRAHPCRDRAARNFHRGEPRRGARRHVGVVQVLVGEGQRARRRVDTAIGECEGAGGHGRRAPRSGDASCLVP